MTLATPSVPLRSTKRKRRITAEQFSRLADTRGLELEDGHVLELKVGAESSLVAGEIFGLLWLFCRDHPVGKAFPPDTAFQFFASHSDRVRKPDAAFIRRDRMPTGPIPKTAIRVCPDLIVEVISPNDKAVQVERKIEEYVGAGVPLLWIVYPETRTARVYAGAGNCPWSRRVTISTAQTWSPASASASATCSRPARCPSPPSEIRRRNARGRPAPPGLYSGSSFPPPLSRDGAQPMDQKLRDALTAQEEYLKKNNGKLYQTSDAGPVRVDLVRSLIETVEKLQDEVSELKRSIAP